MKPQRFIRSLTKTEHQDIEKLFRTGRSNRVRNVSVLVAIGVGTDGYRDILVIVEDGKEYKAGWGGFLRSLKKRSLKGVQLAVSDKCLGLVDSLGECFPEARWQRCTVHFYRNVFSVVPHGKLKEVSAMLKAIHDQRRLMTKCGKDS